MTTDMTADQMERRLRLDNLHAAWTLLDLTHEEAVRVCEAFVREVREAVRE